MRCVGLQGAIRSWGEMLVRWRLFIRVSYPLFLLEPPTYLTVSPMSTWSTVSVRSCHIDVLSASDRRYFGAGQSHVASRNRILFWCVHPCLLAML